MVTTPGGHAITVPNLNTTGGGRHQGGTPPTTTTPSTITLPNGLTVNVGQMTPFRNCLRDHGVTPVPFGQAPRTPLPTRAEMRARIACAPKLPPALEHLYIRARRRFEQRQSCFRTHPRNRAVCARITLGLRSR